MKNSQANTQRKPVGSALDVARRRADALQQRDQPDGPRRELGPMVYGRVVHFVHEDVLGERHLVHGKVAAWGKRGGRVIDKNGNEYTVPFSHMGPGFHPSVAQQQPKKPEAPTT